MRGGGLKEVPSLDTVWKGPRRGGSDEEEVCQVKDLSGEVWCCIGSKPLLSFLPGAFLFFLSFPCLRAHEHETLNLFTD